MVKKQCAAKRKTFPIKNWKLVLKGLRNPHAPSIQFFRKLENDYAFFLV
jgi:hypothetical protein